ncbi:hypothetical protein, partial [Thermogutta sp.]|uniref:hypothetical protein n=1 Tax=Thermogutta sp. TaxID=1962930 RepID=UPI003C7ED9C4
MGKIDKAPEQENREHPDRDALSGEGLDSSEQFLEEPITSRFSFEIRVGLVILGVLGFVLAAVVAYRLMTLRPSETATASGDQSPVASTEKNTGGAIQVPNGAGEQPEQPLHSFPRGEPNGSGGGPVSGTKAPPQPGTTAEGSIPTGAASQQDDRNRSIDANGPSRVSNSETVWPVVPPLNLDNTPVNLGNGPAPRDASESPPLGAPLGSASHNSGYYALEPNQPVATEQPQAVPSLPFGQPDSTPLNATNKGSGLTNQGFTAGWNPSEPDQNSQPMGNDPIPPANPSTLSGIGSPVRDGGGQSVPAANSLDSTPISSGSAAFGTQSQSVPGTIPGDFFAGAPPLSNQRAPGIPSRSPEASSPGQQQSQGPVSPTLPFGGQSEQHGGGLIPARSSQLPLAGTETPATASSSSQPTVPP